MKQIKELGKNYWFCWSGFTVSTFGTYLSLLVINLYIYKITGSPLLVGVFLLVRLIPAFFMGNVAGVLSDKFNRRYLIICADIARAVLILSIAFFSEIIWPIYIVIFLISIMDRLFQSSLGGAIPNIVSKDKLLDANAFLSSGRTVGLICGPVLGGLLLAAGNFTIVFVIDSLTYVFSATMFFLITSNFNVTSLIRRNKIGLIRGLKEGYGYIFARAGLFGVIMIRCLDAFGSSALNVGLPIFAGSFGFANVGIVYGLMFAFFGLGEMIGSLYLSKRPFVQRSSKEMLLGVTIMLMALFFGLSFSLQFLPATLGFLFLSGLAEGVTVVNYNLYLQKNPDDVRGRIVGTSETSVWTVMAVGMFFSGLIAETVPISFVVQLFAGIIVFGSVVYIAILRRRSSESVVSMQCAEGSPDV